MKKLLLFLALAAAGLQGWADDFYIVGDAAEGWKSGNSGQERSNAYKMTKDASSNIYRWTGYLKVNSDNDRGFKICTGHNTWDAWNASESGKDITFTIGDTFEDNVKKNNGDTNDHKWDITVQGYYTLTLNLDSNPQKLTAKLLVPTENDGTTCLISTSAHLKNFATLVNEKGMTGLNAELEEDINAGEDFIPIGTDTKPYAGTFDGNKHTVTLAISNSQSNQGLFGVATGGTNIHDLIVAGSVQAVSKVGGVIGLATNSTNSDEGGAGGTITLTNVINKANVHSTGNTNANAAGFVGCAVQNTIIKASNCGNIGNVSGQNGQCAAFAGWTQDNGKTGGSLEKTKFTNCWNIGEINNMEDYCNLYRNTGKVTAENCYDVSGIADYTQGVSPKLEAYAVTSGELCYKLGNGPTAGTWTQTIGTDLYPVPFNTSQQVYQVVANKSYTNFATANINSTTHAVKIGTSAQLEKFSKEVNAGNNAMNAELTADITGVTSHTPIGTETYKYKGTFDGDWKSITFDINANQDCQALVGYATGGATIKNLILKGTVTNTGRVTAGFIAKTAKSKTTSDTETVYITKCGNEANITGKLGEVAGIVANCTGLNGNNVNSTDGKHCLLNLNQVYNTGEIKIQDNDDNHDIAAICAYGGNCPHSFVEVYNTGTITGAASGKDNFLRNPQDAWTVTRCYTTNRVVESYAKEGDITATQVTSGYLCYKLNNGSSTWKQTIGTDNYPKLFGSTGVVNQVVADKSYSNLTVSDDKVEIGSLANLNQFSAEVNAGNVEMDAILTSNIEDDGTFTPIGTEDYKYKGTFDGDDHYVQLAINKSGTPFQGLFGCATGGAKFKNLIIKGNVIGGNNSAALVGQVGGDGESGTITINRVGCEVNVSGSYEHHGAFVGNDWGERIKLEVENCYNIGDISGSSTTYTSVMGSWIKPESSYTNVFNRGTITGNKFSHDNRGHCYNCYTTTSGAGEVSNLVQGVTSDQITSGKLCYLLNGNTQGGTDWRQTLSGSVDAHPVFFSDHKEVYQYNTSKYVNNGDKVEIGDATDLANFAALVNAGATSVDADQTADIDFSTQSAAGVMIGDKKDNAYSGTYDGQAHEINVTYTSSANNTALFRYISNANLKNIITTGSITTNGEYSCSGGIFAAVENGSDESVVENCLSYVNFIYSNATNRDKTFGGIGAYMRNKGTIQNCAFLGAFNAPNAYGNGGILGYAHSSDVTVKNCYVKASVINVAAKDGDHESKIIVRNKVPSDCYYVSIGNFENQTSGANPVTSDDVTSGKLCYDLGSAWYQDLTIDDYPVPFDTHSNVYRRGEPSSYSYSNITTGSTVKIKSAKDLIDFSALVNEGNYNLNAELTNDIDMTDKSWTPIGKFEKSANSDKDDKNDGSKAYKGTFDGKGHTIDNLVQDETTFNNQGLFGVVNGGCTIKNLILGSGCKFYGGKYVGAFVGSSRGSGWVTIENCGNEANVGSDKHKPSQNAAAFIGVVVGSGPATRILNCYNTGTIKGSNSNDNAILTGWFGGHGSVEVKNFYNIGSVEGYESGKPLYRNGSTGITFTNNYSTTSDQGATKIEEGWQTSGELCYKLNGSEDNGTDWYQDLSQEGYPIPFGTKTVAAGKWFNTSTNDVYYNEDGEGNITVYQLNMSDTQTEYNVPDDGTVTAKNVSVDRSITAGKWVGLCLPFDYDNPSGWDVRELTNVNGTGDEACMIFTAASSIEAGKPYLVKVTGDNVSIISATDKAIIAEAQTIDEFDVNMVGRFNKASICAGDYYITNNSELKKLTASSYDMKGFRAYFTVDGPGVKALSFDIEDDPDGISPLLTSPEEEGQIYNLAGQRIQKMQKGINIVNGKKVLF